MRAHVFPDRALAKHAGRFVWLSVDTEKASNTGFVEKFPIENWPTLLVVEPSAERPVFKWPGSATVEQLERIFADAEGAMKSADGASAATLRLAEADRLSAERKYADAAKVYEEVLATAPKGFDRRSRAVESLTLALAQSKRHADCADASLRETGSLPRGPSFANAAAMGMFCAQSIEGEEGKARAQKLRPLAEEALRLEGILADDRSGLYDALIELAEGDKDEARAKALVAQWVEFLESEWKKAPNPEARAAFDPHLVAAVQKLGQPERAVPMLLASEAALPEDYNAPARLALLYRALAKFDEAVAAHDRAIAKAYGPRKLVVMEQKAQTQVKRGDRAAARATYETAKATAAAMPSSPATQKALTRIDRALSAL